ncbi:MAG: hypothetical protein NPIRA02_05710 [Nitrospirales bacterium]|nr:MAG: hypothetical protein NPIRA02_05710 [Nitrospirales bacterium]
MEIGPFSLGFGTYCVLAKNECVRSKTSEEEADDRASDMSGDSENEDDQ